MLDLPTWLTAVFLGTLEGLTEFLPVSSTGHLLIAEHWLPRQSDLFNVVIQSGAVLAVLPLFKERLAQLCRWREAASRRLLSLIALSFGITAVGGVFLDKLHFRLPESPVPVAWALMVGGVAFLLVERLLKHRTLPSSHSLPMAATVGVAQLVAAVFRSGTTILAAMLSGSNRVTATEFSFLVGIPTLLAASGLKVFKALKHGVQEDWAMLGLATVVAGLVSFLTVKWLLRYVQTHSFAAFGVYRILAGALLLWIL
jgi:undecaprenyl-diphosphatase